MITTQNRTENKIKNYKNRKIEYINVKTSLQGIKLQNKLVKKIKPWLEEEVNQYRYKY